MTTAPVAMRSPVLDGAANSPMSSPTKTPRRVLGDLTPNTKLTPNHAKLNVKSPTKSTYVPSPSKAQDVLQPSVLLPGKENSAITSAGGSKKRPFSAMASPERLDATRSPNKRQAMPFETVSPAALRSPLPPPITVETADEDTDEDEPIDPTTETDVDHIELPNATQGTTGSFSSLIDYNPDNASDKSDPASPASSRSSVPVTSRVELLKLRLRMAMYKINTNQTLVPFAKLEQPHARTPTAVDEEDEQVEELPISPRQSTEVQSSPENIVITGGPIGKLLGGPVFAPTAFSARFVDGPGNLATPPRLSTTDRNMTPIASPTRFRDEENLTSSVVKGHAASGLLELAHAR